VVGGARGAAVEEVARGPRRGIGGLLEAREVEARTEGAAFAREHHRAQPALAGQTVAGLHQRFEHLGVEGVQLVGPVEPHVGHAVLAERDHDPIGHGSSW
jgi:hypothetical protein